LRRPIDIPAAGTVRLADVLAGFLWITVLFAGLIGFARTFETERRDGALEVLLLAPLDRSGLFVAKAVANLVYIVLVEIFLLPAFAILYGVDLGSSFGALVLVALLVDIGFVSTGTLFASLAARTRSRELMLPILALPAVVPVFIAAVELSSDLFLGGGFDAVTETGWFAILVVFDIVFSVVGALGFEFAIE
jgi:heme exporter protein B